MVAKNRTRVNRINPEILVPIGMLIVALISWDSLFLTGSWYPEAVQGTLDLREWDFAKGGITDLRGEWEFYWNQVIDPSTLDADFRELTGYVKPGFWDDYALDGVRLPGEGVATYALTVLLPQGTERLGIKLAYQYTAYKLFVNGREVSSDGIVAKSPEEVVARFTPKSVYIDVDDPSVRFVMQVGNSEYRHGGMWEAPEIGTEQAIRTRATRFLVFDIYTAGALTMMALYHLLVHIMRKNDKSVAYFSLICVCFAARSLTLGEMAIARILPSLEWSSTVRFMYATSAAMVPLGILFIYQLYPGEASKTPAKISVIAYFITAAVVVICPIAFVSRFMYLYQCLCALPVVYILAVLIVAAKKRRAGAFSLAWSTAVFCLTLSNDMFYYNGTIKTGSISTVGLLIVCIAQSRVLASRFSGALASVERLSEELSIVNLQLTDLNTDLEQRVSDRTSALVESNRMFARINEEIERMEESRKHLLANIAHDLRTPVTLIQGYVEAMLDGIIEDPEQRVKYLNLIAGKTAALSHLIADLFELSQLESRRATFNPRPVLFADLIDELYMKYEGDIANAGITPRLSKTDGALPDDLEVNVDPELIDRVVANLVYNAVKFTPHGGVITISYGTLNPPGPEKRPDWAVASISDTGAGIAAEDLPFVFDRFYKAPRSRSQASGSGLGLSIAREIVDLHAGQIWVESSPGNGSIFFFTLPVFYGFPHPG